MLTRKELLEIVWGYRFDPGTNVVDVHITRLRRKLEGSGGGGLIRTVRGIGYALDGVSRSLAPTQRGARSVSPSPPRSRC